MTISPFSVAFAANANDGLEVSPTENHHIIELNSNQPYVAGYHVNNPDINTFEGVRSTGITVSFPSTDPNYFPAGSWLGAGMFVQAQDIKLRNVDYAFYTMLVLDASGGFFLDVGLHQTREATAPLQMPTEDLLYAYTWRVSGIEPSTPVNLLATFDSEGFVHYSISASGTNITLTSINVTALPGCASIIKHFFAGNNIAVLAFPYARYVNYFQFGVVSSQIIANKHWSADLKDPRILRKPGSRFGAGWHLVSTAWSTQGDISYLDSDWKWGGAPYPGTSAKYHKNPLENPNEVIFFYNGQTLRPGTVLWQNTSSKTNGSAASPSPLYNQIFERDPARSFSIETVILTGIATGTIGLWKMRKKSINIQKTKRMG